MPNTPAENTVSTSFTLPRELMDALKLRAKSQMTNTSELIRRALMNYLSEDERAAVLRDMGIIESGSYPRGDTGAEIIHDGPALSPRVKAAAEAVVKLRAKRKKQASAN